MLNKEMLVPKMLPSSLRSYCLLRCLRTRSHIFMNICEVSGSSGDMSFFFFLSTSLLYEVFEPKLCIMFYEM